MSYASEEISQQDGNPVLLFTFARGSTVWRYVMGPQSFSWGGHSFVPEAIGCGGFNFTGDIPKDPLTITLPITNALAATFLPTAPDAVTTVTVFRTSYTATPDGETVWKGRVLSVSTSIATMILTCEPVFVSMRRLGLRETYQRLCRHMLYGAGCNVSAAAHAVAVTVTAVAGADVTVSGFLTFNYVQGTIKALDGTVRMIVGQNTAGTVLTLMRPVQSLVDSIAAHPGGFSATIYPGCSKTLSVCSGTFGNAGNFGGFTGITGINPMTGISNVF